MGRALLLALAAFCAAGLAPRAASAQSSDAAPEAQRTEAAERFDRGLRLFNRGDTAGALAEFRRAYSLIPNVLVLYNIGLVYAQMGRPVEASDALEQVLGTPGTLSPERLATARRTHDEQVAQTAEITVTANVDGATVEVDGVEAVKLPLARPLRVTSGNHVIGVIAAGFAPLRREVTIASREAQSLPFELIPMQGRLAHLEVKTHVPGADVYADGQRIGMTPLDASFPLSPGVHGIELRRPGYTTAHAEVTLGEGASGEVTLEPEEDATSLPSMGGLLALALDETEVVVTIDGHLRGVYSAPLRLTRGPHHLLAERGNFEPVENDLVIDSGHTTTLHLVLEPTPEYRAQFVSRAHSQRTWGVISAVAGVVVAAGGAGLVIYDASQRSDGNAALSALQAQSTLGSNAACDLGQDFAALTQRCTVPKQAATSKVDDANLRDDFGWPAIGVGAAAVVLGVVLLVTADDPHRYDRPEASGAAVLGPVRALPIFWSAPGGGGGSLVGTF
jgi:PEGA domain